MPDTPDPDPPKSELPLTHAVTVHEMREGRPVPIAAFEFREDGQVRMLGPDAMPAVYRFLLAAAQKAARHIAARALIEPPVTPHPEPPCCQ